MAAVLNRENLPGYFHTYAKSGVSNLQYALGEGHVIRHEEVFRMDYSNVACMMDCMKPSLVKVWS